MASSRHRPPVPHRLSAALKAGTVPVGAGAPANTGGAGAMHRGACFAGMPAPTGMAQHLRSVQYLYE